MSLKTARLYLAFACLSVPFWAFADPEIDIKIPVTPSHVELHQTPDDEQAFSGIHQTVYTISERMSQQEVVEEATEIIENARKENPNFQQVMITVVLERPQEKSGVEVAESIKLAKIIHNTINDASVMAFEPTAKFGLGIRTGHRNDYLALSEVNLAKMKMRISIVRAIVNGVVTGVSLYIAEGHLLAPAIAGGMTQALIGYGLMRREQAYAHFLEGNAFWDPHGDFQLTESKRWKLVYECWKTARHAAVISVILAAVAASYGVVHAMQDANPDILRPSWDHISTVIRSGVFSAASFGRIKRLQTAWTFRRHLENAVENFAQPAEGRTRAEQIAYKTFAVAFAISVVSTFFETLGISSVTSDFSDQLRLYIGVGGWGYFSWKFLGLKDVAPIKKAREFVKSWFSKAVEGAKGFKDGLSHAFSGRPKAVDSPVRLPCSSTFSEAE